MNQSRCVNMRTIILLLFLAAAAFADKLVWSDEFDGIQLDSKKWEQPQYNRRNNPNGPDGWWLKEDAFLDGKGHLIIRTRRIANLNNDKDPYDYSSGAIRSFGRFEKRFGRFEIRCRLPQQPGWWAAFWLFTLSQGNVDGSGEDGTEIDIIETYGWTDVVQHALHWDGYGAHHQTVSKRFNMEDIRKGFHTFALEWYENLYIFFIDGVESWRTDAGGVSKVPSYVKITGELSTEDWATSTYWANDPAKAVFPDSFIVDYVRVYELEQTYSTKPDPNDHLAHRKSVTASSMQSLFYHPRRAVDGDISTRWASSAGAPQWLMVDLKNRYTVDRVIIHWGKNYGREYKIEAADAKEGPWREALHVADNSSSGLVEHTFFPQTGRFVRLYGIQSAGENFSVIELAVYGREPTAVLGPFEEPQKPSSFELNVHPNPFNHSVLLTFKLPTDDSADLIIRDLLGQTVRRLISGKHGAGSRQILWDGRDESGILMPSGVYYAQLITGSGCIVRKLVLVR